MKRYSVPLDQGTKTALSALKDGINRIGVVGRSLSGELVFGCIVETTSGRVVVLRAAQHDLEYKFEVFPLAAELVSGLESAQELQTFALSGPVDVVLLETQDWIDPAVTCNGAVGEHPIAQCQGQPGTEPETAVSTCRYVGGVELRGSNNVQLTVATASFPFAISISAISRTGSIDSGAYAYLIHSGV